MDLLPPAAVFVAPKMLGVELFVLVLLVLLPKPPKPPKLDMMASSRTQRRVVWARLAACTTI